MMTETKKTGRGGARAGAGAKRTVSLDAGELRLLLHLLTDSTYAAEYADTAEKLRRMIERETAK